MFKKIWLSLFIGLFFLSANGVFAAEKININTATRVQLETLKGIGPVIAAAIIEHRETAGKFKTVGELTDVKGIGDKKLGQFIDQVVVSPPKPK